MKVLFFDVGYTLVNEDAVWKKRCREQAEMEEAKKLGLTADDIYHEIEIASVSRKPQYRTVVEKYGFKEVAPYRTELEMLYEEAPDVIKALAQKYELGIIANQLDGLKERLEAFGLLQYFKYIVSSWDVQVMKPDVRIFEYALQLSKCDKDPARAWMIGDRLDNDVLPAKKLGMKTVWIKQGFGALQKPESPSEEPDYTISGLGELLKIFIENNHLLCYPSHRRIRDFMKYSDLDIYWKKIFELNWQSVCNGSKAISALLIDEKGNIISEARNQVGETAIPNPRVCHAESECIRNLDISKYPNLKAYTLFCALEPCPMCMGTAAMSGIHNFVIACKDDYGGAMELAKYNKLLQRRNFNITYLPEPFGDIQRGFQFIKELLYEKNSAKLSEIEEDFNVHNARGVKAAKMIFEDGWFNGKSPSDYTAEQIFDRLAELIGAMK